MKSLGSIMLSMLLLLTNLGWVQTTHYCLGRPMEAHVALEITALSCGMESIESDSKTTEPVPGCCHDESERFSLDQHVLSNGIDLVLTQMDWSWCPLILETELTFPSLSQPSVKYQFLEQPPPESLPLFLLHDQWLI